MSASTATSRPPSRTLEQRHDALKRANVIRRQRADDKQRIKDRDLDARDILLSPPEYWKDAQISVLLRSVRGVGHTKVEKMLRKLQISPAKTLGGMTDAQRQRLADALSRFYENREL